MVYTGYIHTNKGTNNMTTNRNAIEIESITQAIFKKLESDSNFDGDIALGFNDGQIFIQFENETYEIAINTYNN